MSNVTPLHEEESQQRPQLRIPSFEGLNVDRHYLTFSGSIEIVDQAILDAVRLNKTVEVVVSGLVKGAGHNVKTDADGYYEETVRRSTLKVDTVALIPADEPELA